MATLTYNYVYFASGPHTRQPRSSSGPGGFTLIQSFAGGTLTAGDTFAAPPQPASMPVGADTYPFAFLSVSGGTGGGVVSTKSNVPPAAVTVGTAAIQVLVVYAPAGGIGGNNPGATIDSFDIVTGALFNDTFVTVVPDPGATLTHSGNTEGWVPTANAPFTIDAISSTSPTGVDFSYWLTFPNTTSTSANLPVTHDESVSALAFYKAPVVPVPNPCQQAVKFLQQIIDDGDKPRLTIQQFNEVEAQLEKCVAEGQLTQAQVTQLLNAYKGDLNPPHVPTPAPNKL